MRLAILSVSCLLTACFTEPSADRVWKCSVDQPLCPEGQDVAIEVGRHAAPQIEK